MNSANYSAHAAEMPIVTVIGDGQLARMMHTTAIELGLSLRVLAGAADASAAQVTSDVLIGDYTDLEDLRSAAVDATVVTFDHEHVPTDHITTLINEGVNIQPGPTALINAQDKLIMRQKLADIGAPVPAFAAIDSVADALSFYDQVAGAVCLKARRGGYDGYGVWLPADRSELEALTAELLAAGTPLMAEQKVPLNRELSAMVARRASGETQTWPVVESVQTNGICTEAIAPAPGLSDELADAAQQLAVMVATKLDVTGVMAVELFEASGADGKPEILVNELAMRPHNTGHWTQDGCVTSQFEQHLRAVLDWPLGATTPLAPVTVMVNTLGADSEPDMPLAQRIIEVLRRFPAVKIHLYGKSYRAGRKLGHVNLSGTDLEKTRADARAAAHFLVQAQWPKE